MPAAQPLCLVLTPSDQIYNEAILPAAEAAGMIPLRAGDGMTGGVLRRGMVEWLLLYDYVIADLGLPDPAVFFALGVRHAARPAATLSVYATDRPVPLDTDYLEAVPYDIADTGGLKQSLIARLNAARETAAHQQSGSPLLDLIGDWKSRDIARLKTDVFRDRVRLKEEPKERMRNARALRGEEGLANLRSLRAELASLESQEPGVLIDLMLSFRALEGWSDMIGLIEAMPEVLKRQVMVREQLGFAYNRRAGDKTRTPEDREADRRIAQEILEAVEAEQGPNSETSPLIGRIYKDRWDEARAADSYDASCFLDEAISAYLRGFLADHRDSFPGINAVTLLDIRGDEDSLLLRDTLLPVVQFAVDRRMETRSADYWDHATNIELAVLACRKDAARYWLHRAMELIREPWEPKTTARNLGLIRDARRERGEEVEWLEELIGELNGGRAEVSGRAGSS